jgi:hypothetical protein
MRRQMFHINLATRILRKDSPRDFLVQISYWFMCVREYREQPMKLNSLYGSSDPMNTNNQVFGEHLNALLLDLFPSTA